MPKYQPLGRYLASLPTTVSEIKLSFHEVAEIIEAALPQSAKVHRAWWTNQKNGSMAPHWTAAGFEVADVDFVKEFVRFRRLSPANELGGPFTLQEVVTAINERTRDQAFGHLQAWRKQHKHRRIAGTPFHPVVKEGRNYAYHSGGYDELQFNVGFETVDGIRVFGTAWPSHLRQAKVCL